MATKHIRVIFGGTFDPFTCAHKRIVEKLMDKFKPSIEDNNVDFSLIIAPSIVSWYRKDKPEFLDYNQRVAVITEMLNGIQYDTYYQIWTKDFDRAVALSKTSGGNELLKQRGFIDTLQDIIADNTWYEVANEHEYEYYFVIGSDQLQMFKEWKNWKSILALAKMIVVQGRNGERIITPDFCYDEITIEPEFKDVSASELRNTWQGKPFSDFFNWIHMTYAMSDKVQTLVKTPIFTVTKGPEIQPNFFPIKVNAPNWATIIVEKDNKFLAVKQLRYGNMHECTEFPCGMVEKDEPPIVAAYRELKEETGVKLKAYNDIKVLGSYSPNPAFMTNKMYYFYVNLDKVDYELGNTELDEHEKIENFWLDKKEMWNIIKDDHNTSAIMAAAFVRMHAAGIDCIF